MLWHGYPNAHVQFDFKYLKILLTLWLHLYLRDIGTNLVQDKQLWLLEGAIPRVLVRSPFVLDSLLVAAFQL